MRAKKEKMFAERREHGLHAFKNAFLSSNHEYQFAGLRTPSASRDRRIERIHTALGARRGFAARKLGRNRARIDEHASLPESFNGAVGAPKHLLDGRRIAYDHQEHIGLRRGVARTLCELRSHLVEFVSTLGSAIPYHEEKSRVQKVLPHRF